MKIEFTFVGEKFTLDLVKGELLGYAGKEKDTIIQAIKKGLEDGQYGAVYENIPPTQISDPYHNVSQFALCLLFNVGLPKELESYIPHWDDIKQAEASLNLLDELEVCY